jgi:hypothetical protein
MKKLLDLIRNKSRVNEAYKSVFTTPEGEIVLAHLCKVNFVFTTTFVKGDPYQTALHEGQRRLTLSILRQLNVDYTKLESIAQEITDEN